MGLWRVAQINLTVALSVHWISFAEFANSWRIRG